MARTFPVDVEALYDRHDQLLLLDEELDDLVRETTSPERELASRLQAITHEILEQLEDILDSDQSRAVMEDVRRHGAAPWEDVEAELDRQCPKTDDAMSSGGVVPQRTTQRP